MKLLGLLPLLVLGVACGQDRGSNSKSGNPDSGQPDATCLDCGDMGQGGGSVGTVPSDELKLCSEGWCWVNPRPYGATLHAVHGVGSDVFIVGSGGTVLQRLNDRWTGHIARDAHLYDVFAVRSDLAYAVGPALDELSLVYVYRWDGSTWERVHTIDTNMAMNPVGPAFTPAGIWASESEVYVGAGSQVHHFDGAWAEVTTPGGDGWVSDIACASGQCYAVGQVGSHLRFASEGFIWRLDSGAFVDEGVAVGALTAVDVRADGSFIAAGVSGANPVTATQTGSGWEVSDDAPGALADLVVGPDGVEWAVSTTFTFWNVHSREAGGTWVDQALPLQRVATLGPARNIPGLYSSGAELFFVGRSDSLAGEIARFDGSAWETFTPPAEPTDSFVDISLSATHAAGVSENSTTIWDRATGEQTSIEGGGSSVWVFGDRVFVAGSSVEEVTSGSAQPVAGAPDRIDAFFAVSPDLMFAADGLTISRFDGSSWTSEDLPEESVQVQALWARSADDAFAVVNVSSGSATVPVLWRFDGTAWTGVEGPTDDLSDPVMAGNDTELIVAGYRTSAPWAFTFDGTTASPDQRLSFRLTDIAPLPDGDFLATEGGGAVYRGKPGNWTREPQLVEIELSAVATDDDGNAWVAGVLGSVLSYDAP